MKEFIDKLIGRLEELKTEALDKWDGGASHRAYSKAIDIANELAEEYNNGWIPCSERLPDNDNEVLCWYEYRIMQGTCIGEMTHRYGIGWYSKKSDIWVGEVSVGVDCKVIAWQPLPQPYAEQKQPIWKQQTMNRFERVE